MKVTPLGPGREFEIIRRILGATAAASEPQSAPDTPATSPGRPQTPGAPEAGSGPGTARGSVSAPRVLLGPGDDCTLFQVGDRQLAVTSDMAIEDVHFRRDWGTPEEIGARAVLAALSDLAAMAAEPVGVLISLSVPAKDDGADDAAELAEHVGAGCREAVAEHGASLVGGDLSRGSSELVLDVTAIGWTDAPLLRSGARPGDELWVTGELGAAAAAVRAWQNDGEPEAAWRERFWRPRPRIAEARWLAEQGASAAIDVSDGTMADAAHLAAASLVAIEVDLEPLPTASGVQPTLALSGGEDYELLVTAEAGILDADTFARELGTPFTKIGRVVSGQGVRVFREGREVKLDVPGFDHFA